MKEKDPPAYLQLSNQEMDMDDPKEVMVEGTPIGQPTWQTRWSWCHLVTSVISIFLCHCCGIPATVLSLLSYIEHKTNLYESSRQKRQVALGLAIAGIVVGSIVIILYIVLYTALLSSALEKIALKIDDKD